MSSVVISGNTSGTITLDAPAVAGTTTLTLPATSGTVVTKDTNGIASVNGIQFPATQSASADANCLDDYEEGTWTPAFTSTGFSVSYGQQRGIYIKIGRCVTVSIYIQTLGTSGTTTNSLSITGLPFATTSSAEYGFSGTFGVQQFSTYVPSAFMSNGSTSVTLYRQNTITALTGAQLANGFYLFTITYLTD